LLRPRESGERLERAARRAQQVHRARVPLVACRAIGGRKVPGVPMKKMSLAFGAVALLSSTPAFAALISSHTIGSGLKSATLQFDFESGNAHLVTLRWNGDLNGFQALQMVAAQVNGAQLDYQSFSFGNFVTGIGIGGDYQYGEGDLWPVENYWHYWNAEGTGAWSESMVGADARMLSDGSRDAWGFGSNALPQAVPGPGVLGLLAGAGLCARRRRA
jgi:hypothetical protein